MGRFPDLRQKCVHSKENVVRPMTMTCLYFYPSPTPVRWKNNKKKSKDLTVNQSSISLVIPLVDDVNKNMVQKQAFIPHLLLKDRKKRFRDVQWSSCSRHPGASIFGKAPHSPLSMLVHPERDFHSVWSNALHTFP